MGFPGNSDGKESIHLQCGRPGFHPWVGKIPWRRKERLPTPVFWPGEFHGLYSQWSRKESDTTEWLSLSLYDGSDNNESACNTRDPGSIPGSGRAPGEGNGNPLLYSCLENPMDRGTWWATVYDGSQGVRKDWVIKTHIYIFIYYISSLYTLKYLSIYIDNINLVKNNVSKMTNPPHLEKIC